MLTTAQRTQPSARITGRLQVLALILACASCSDDGDTTGTTTRGLPLFEATTVTMPDVGIAAVGLSQPSAELVAVILSADARLWLYPLDGAASPTEVLSGVAVPIEGDLQVVRSPDGTIDVLWKASGDIHHATGQGTTGWSTSVAYAGVVDSGTSPSLALGADGGVHAAWVGLQSGTWMAFYGTWNGSSWTSEAVRSAESTFQWAGLAVAGSTVLLAGTNQDGMLWLAQKNGDAWIDQPVDLGEYIHPNVGNTQAIAAGPAGVAIMFGSNPRMYAAWRPAGASSFQVDEVGEMYTGFVWEPRLRVGNASAISAAMHNERVSAWERSAPFWPRIASFPRDSLCSSSEESVGMTLDSEDQPVLVVRGCDGKIQVLRQIDSYPEDWNQRCQAAITRLCDLACDCASAGDCAYAYSNGYTPGGNRSGCELGARDNVCGDSTSPPEELASCVATLEPATCGTYGYPVDDACLPLIE